MKSFLEFMCEDLHPDIVSTLDGYDKDKHKAITKHIRNLISNGEETGLEGAKAKKGSSRAVFLPKDPKEIKIDGVNTHMKTALKIAYQGELDTKKLRGRKGFLGEMQNDAESSHYFNQHSILKKVGYGNKEFETNEEHGVLAPLTDKSNDGSWLEMGRVDNITPEKFKELTRNETHPEGLRHQDVAHIMENEHLLAFGKGKVAYSEREQAIHDHPFTQKMVHLIHNTDLHPGDIFTGREDVGDNMWVWTHPVTGKEYPVVRDYGCTHDVAREYKLRRAVQRDL